jgi:hypothetical protein
LASRIAITRGSHRTESVVVGDRRHSSTGDIGGIDGGMGAFTAGGSFAVAVGDGGARNRARISFIVCSRVDTVACTDCEVVPVC